MAGSAAGTAEDRVARAEASLATAQATLEGLRGRLRAGDPDRDQLLAFRAAWAAAEVLAGERLLALARETGGALEAALARVFAHEAAREEPDAALYEDAADLLAEMPPAASPGASGLGEEHRMLADAIRRFSDERVAPLAEEVHRKDLLVPEPVIQGLREIGGFGLSIPQRYGGLVDDARPDGLGMVVVTEELSRGSLGAAGSLITRPEILARALLKGGTEEQKGRLLPAVARGEKMVAVCVTEPDCGSDVASIKLGATPVDGGWELTGTKTWATFAGRAELLLVLARTDRDPSKRHKGLSLFVAEKPPFAGHAFEHVQLPRGGSIAGRAIGTIGYRGMHSYEVVFDRYFCPAENLIGGEAGLGKGFYLQMEGFQGGRLQTAARACGVMQAALEAALRYARERTVFGAPVASFQLAKVKLARMAAHLAAARRLCYHAAGLVDRGGGHVESSLVKLFAARTAEWVTREAQQLHGGMGYAEEFPVSRYFVDARVLSIFEGAEEVLAVKVIARELAK